MSSTEKNPQQTTPVSEADFHGAAIIAEDGKEVPITEDMVTEACDKMDADSEQS